MDEKGQIQLKTACITKVPFQTYDEFTFIVNNERFKTTRIIADLLSDKICRNHSNDPTLNEYIINTTSKGDFSNFLNLINFEQNEIPESEFPFISEIINILEINSLNISITNFPTEITINNVFSFLLKHEKYDQIYSENINKEIDFISSHFYEINESNIEEISKLRLSTIEKIISNKRLQLKDENQLLSIINRLYSKEIKYSILYEYVCFTNVGSESIAEFIDIFDHNDLNSGIWKSISNRLKQKIESIEPTSKTRYKEDVQQQKKQTNEKGITFLYKSDKNFYGILRHLLNEHNGNIKSEVTVTSSSFIDSDYPENVYLFDNDNKLFYSNKNKGQDQWLCFDFQKHKIIPSNYTIKSTASLDKPKSWVIEGSNDNSEWVKIDERNDDASLKNHWTIHTFNISNKTGDAYRYVRIRQTGPNWYNRNYLTFGSFEFYGVFI